MVASPVNKATICLLLVRAVVQHTHSHQDDFLLSPRQWAPRSVHCFEVSVSQVQLAAHKDDWRSGAEVFDFRVPHSPHMVQRVWVSD